MSARDSRNWPIRDQSTLEAATRATSRPVEGLRVPSGPSASDQTAVHTAPREVILDAILMPDATREGAAVRNAGRRVLDELLNQLDRLRLAVRSIDEPYPIDVFPDLQERDAVFAAMREVNRYATEQFCSEIARQRGTAARSYLEDGDLGD